MQKGFVGILILLGIILTVMIGSGAYYLGTRKPASVVPSPTPVVTSSPSDTSPISTDTGETANWKTYTNGVFSFRYPQDYYIIRNDESVVSLSSTPNDLEPPFIVSYGKNASIFQWQSFSEICSDKVSVDCFEVPVSDTILGDKPAKDFIFLGGFERIRYVQTDNPKLQISYSMLIDPQTAVYGEILSTFKFKE